MDRFKAPDLGVSGPTDIMNDVADPTTMLSAMDFAEKSDHQLGGPPVVRLTFRGIHSPTALVQRLSLRCITCPAHLILFNLA
ncbi:hypothetical protein ANCDUO_06528 [Ancylostoma duodenale]|uniref:Uncharacterized protein n=1 Tax=Ancylostoma duodenale TaxID=51022 RepID=A0A0C2H192_9BILA|nr:hypothetical protein ANCDUO_06528 [Ancylostoma duodenale]